MDAALHLAVELLDGHQSREEGVRTGLNLLEQVELGIAADMQDTGGHRNRHTRHGLDTAARTRHGGSKSTE